MSAIYKKLANAVYWLHWLWIAWLIIGGVLQVFFPWYAPIHIIVVTTTIASQLIFLGCPLVALENAIRRKYDKRFTYHGSFVSSHLRNKYGIDAHPAVITAALIFLFVMAVTIWLW